MLKTAGNFIFLQNLYLIAFWKATFEHAESVYSFGVYMEHKQNIIFQAIIIYWVTGWLGLWWSKSCACVRYWGIHWFFVGYITCKDVSNWILVNLGNQSIAESMAFLQTCWEDPVSHFPLLDTWYINFELCLAVMQAFMVGHCQVVGQVFLWK